MFQDDKEYFTCFQIVGPNHSLTDEEARAYVLERVNAYARLSGDKFVTGRSYGIGDPASYNMYLAYFTRGRSDKGYINISYKRARSAREILLADEHDLCD